MEKCIKIIPETKVKRGRVLRRLLGEKKWTRSLILSRKTPGNTTNIIMRIKV